MMKFYELAIGDLFTFHSFSQEVWQKVGEEKCICLNYADSEIDEPLSVKDNVFPVKYMGNPSDIYGNVKGTEYPVSMFQSVEKVERKEEVDNFQPLSLITALRRYITETKGNSLLQNEDKREGVILGLAWAIAEVMQQATAKDRFIPRG